MDMQVRKLAVTLVVALALVLSVGTASVMGEIPHASADYPNTPMVNDDIIIGGDGNDFIIGLLRVFNVFR